VFERLAELTATLLGRSAYQRNESPYVAERQTLDAPQIVEARKRMGGQLELPTVPQTRWYLAQLEAAEFAADGGNLEQAGLLMRAARSDGVFAGVLSTRTSGLVRLPIRFRGDPDVVASLEIGHGDAAIRSVFDEMFPSSELAQLAADGICLGVGVGELVPVEGRDYPVFVRLQPQFLVYRWIDNAWYFRSAHGLIPVVPGDGRWILHCPGGRSSPWMNGIWRAIGRAYIRKHHAALQKDNWEGKLANPARVAVSPAGGSEEQSQAWFRQVMAWGINTVFGMRPGYDVKLIESNGRGWESFNKTIADQNTEMIIAVAGQTVTVDGGAGFQNSDIHKSIRADLIKETADGLAYTINTQGIPAYVARIWGEDAINDRPCVVDWDVTPPKDRNSEAMSLSATANAIIQLTAALVEHGQKPDVAALCTRFAIPVEAEPESEPAAPDSALDGGQVDSLLTVIGQVALGQLPRESGVEIIRVAFNVDRETAERLLGTVGNGFVPAPIADADGGGDADELPIDEADPIDDDELDDELDDDVSNVIPIERAA